MRLFMLGCLSIRLGHRSLAAMETLPVGPVVGFC
jgi:hypothetical protein